MRPRSAARALRVLPVVLAMLALATAAHACAVCGAEGAARNRAAFFNSTILLSLLPLGLMGGGVWWIARRLPGGLAAELEVTDSTAGEGVAAPPAPGDGAARRS